MKISKITLFLTMGLFITSQVAFSAKPTGLKEDLEAKSMSALACASNYGTVDNVRITYWNKQGDTLYVRGDYKIIIFFSFSGSFEAIFDNDFDLMSMSWKEPNGNGWVSNDCLN